MNLNNNDELIASILEDLNQLTTKEKVEILDIILDDINVCLCDKCDKEIAATIYNKREQ